MKRIAIYILLVLAAAFMISCNPIPEGLQKKAQSKTGDLKNGKESLKKNKDSYESFLGENKYLEQYAKRESLTNKFTAANEQLKLAEASNKKIQALIEENDGETVNQLNTLMKSFDQNMADAKSLYTHPKDRLVFLSSVNEKTGDYKKESGSFIASIHKNNETYGKYGITYNAKYPDKKKQIDKDVSGMVLLDGSSQTLYDNFLSQCTKKDSNKTFDLLVIANNYSNLKSNSAHATKITKDFIVKVKNLDHSISKTLVDMDAKYYVQVGRTSWDESSDSYTEKDRTFPLEEVDEKTFEYFDELSDNVVLATYNRGWSDYSLSVKVNKAHWKKVVKKPLKYNWPSDYHDYSEFWINDTKVKYYHKYKEEIDGKVTTSKWVEVNEDMFYDNLENIDMMIYSKPIGTFKHETVNTATPPGLSYVGNEAYGKWEKDEKGDRFWHFYGQYAFYNHIFGYNYYYPYGYYNTYRTTYMGRRPYYGGGRFGTTGTMANRSRTFKSSTYNKKFANNKNSSISKTGVKSYTKSQASVRKGGSNRGGGPGGGGK